MSPSVTVQSHLPAGWAEREMVEDIRRTFTLTKPTDVQYLWLSISYDDAFILYINGQEIIRNGVKEGSGKDAKGIAQHEALGKFEMFDLSPHARHLKAGTNTIAIEGHNHDKKSSDFTLHPTLVIQKK